MENKLIEKQIVKIEKGIKFVGTTGKDHRLKYPFKFMEEGDSFVYYKINNDDTDKIIRKNLNKSYSACCVHNRFRKDNLKFVRAIYNSEIRVWLIKV